MRALRPLPQSVAWAEGIVRAAGAPPKGCLPCGTPGKPRPLYRLGSGPVSPIASTDDIDVDYGKQVMEFLRVYDNLLKPVKGCSVVWDRQTLQVGLLWDRGVVFEACGCNWGRHRMRGSGLPLWSSLALE
jgi:hypothetical protein